MRGAVAGEGSNFVQMGAGEEISLNLARQSVAGYVQTGNDLVITLVDGREIVLSGYFNGTGEANQLYLSQNGEVVAVELSNAGDGTMFASYGPTDGWDKFSTLDDLRFGQSDDLALAQGATDEPAGMAAFVPGLLGLGPIGAGLAGLGVIGGLAGGGGGGGTGPRPPTVNDPDGSQTVTTETPDQTLDVSGTGEPGDRVVVTVGDKTQTTTIGPDGTWHVDFEGTGLPADGTHEAVVDFGHPDGTSTTLDGPTFIVDVHPPEVEITHGAKSVGDVENAVEYTNGVTIGGEGEVGAAIVVKVGEHTQTTTVAADGTWSVTFTTTQVAAGEYEIPFTVTATDALGNDTILNDILVVDTVPHPIGFNPVTADNTVNGAEATAGFQISGTSTAGATLSVTIQGQTQSVTVGANGSWTINYAAGALTAGEYDATITATTTDAAGNLSNATHTFRVDTMTSVAFAPGAIATDGTVNATEASNGITMTGTAQPGATVQVAWNGANLPATVGADGSWTVNFPASGIAGGTYSTTATVTATDAAGNTAMATRTVLVDTETSVSINPGQSGGDDIVSGAERISGLSLTGHAEAGATVKVTFEGVTRTVTADASGNWTAPFSQGEYRAGTYTSTVQVTSTDTAGNVANDTHSVRVDTEVVPFQRLTMSAGSDDVVNFDEAANGLTVTGNVEAGSTVMIRFGSGASVPATVSADGSWTVRIPASHIPAGENNVPMTITATDAVGNTSTLNETVTVDTVVRNLARTGGAIAGDGTINATEAAAGVTMTGTVEPNSAVLVRLSNGQEISTNSGTSGTWSVTFADGQLPHGTGTASVAITATDPAGNVKTISETFAFDTEAPDALDTLKIVRDGHEVTGIYTTQEGEDVTIHRIDANGSGSDVTHAVTEGFSTSINGVRLSVDAYDFDNGVPDGSYLVINNSDAAGNEASTLLIVDNTNTVTVDLHRLGLTDFDLSTIDLSFAPQASMTLTAADLQALTGPDHRLVINGGSDDTVRLDDVVSTGASEGGYAVYHLTTGTVLVDEDITRTLI
ncbi:MAG: Ig-like domain-containing protein [Paracoccaceae bacterium]